MVFFFIKKKYDNNIVGTQKKKMTIILQTCECNFSIVPHYFQEKRDKYGILNGKKSKKKLYKRYLTVLYTILIILKLF